MAGRSSLALKLTLALCFGGLALFAGVGAIDLFTGKSFLHQSFSPGGGRMAMLDEERVAAAARNKGSYATALDPEVATAMGRGRSLEFVGATMSCDADGQRRRVGPEPADGAQRIIVLGDSVAFGFGVDDDQIIAHHLEAYLASCVGDARPRPLVRTVACPGWNTRNACRCLQNRLAELRPDLVLFVPVGNDLNDAYTVTDTGHRSLAYDPRTGSGFPHVSAEQRLLLFGAFQRNYSTAMAAEVLARGGVNRTLAHVVTSGLSPESIRRWQQQIADLRLLQERLQARGCPLLIAFTDEAGYGAVFQDLVGKALPELVMLHTLSAPRPLPHDPHPGPGSTRAIAWCLARHLLERGLIEGVDKGTGPADLPEIDPEFAALRAKPRGASEAEAIHKELRGQWAEFFVHEVAPGRARGPHQVYGSVHVDGMVERNLWLSLARPAGGRQLSLSLERLPASSSIYPLQLEVHINGVALPEELGDAEYVDVLVRASNWVIDRREGITRLASFRLQRLGFD